MATKLVVKKTNKKNKIIKNIMKNSTNLVPIQEVQYLKNIENKKTQLPSVEEIERNGISEELKRTLLDPHARFDNNLEVYCYVCYVDEVTVEFRMGCLATGCSDKEPSYWHHNRDGCRDSRMLITNKGMLSCGNCGLKLSMSNWSFACSRHYGDYRSMSQDSWEKSMAYALCMKNTNNATKQLNVYVTNHPEKFGFN